jgi:hypothetical protein
MTFIGLCIPCQYGDHDEHHEVIRAVPEGVMGGAVCGCDGKCAERYVPPRSVLVTESIDTTALDFLSQFEDRDAPHNARQA